MYYELVYSLNVKSFTKICFAPTCVREEPSALVNFNFRTCHYRQENYEIH